MKEIITSNGWKENTSKLERKNKINMVKPPTVLLALGIGYLGAREAGDLSYLTSSMIKYSINLILAHIHICTLFSHSSAKNINI